MYEHQGVGTHSYPGRNLGGNDFAKWQWPKKVWVRLIGPPNPPPHAGSALGALGNMPALCLETMEILVPHIQPSPYSSQLSFDGEAL